ncbi:hypothetical protein Nepgr_017434 [Nepenthes gracilis]|uniref:Uncharacterized protein n=1 Tax=Nepenthes gracilis TaxID=150966 RepID=A0AAD3SQD5_NEPGR|nr:hypothetical protein Nepgr_017434 [Nepenthes gracilis]
MQKQLHSFSLKHYKPQIAEGAKLISPITPESRTVLQTVTVAKKGYTAPPTSIAVLHSKQTANDRRKKQMDRPSINHYPISKRQQPPGSKGSNRRRQKATHQPNYAQGQAGSSSANPTATTPHSIRQGSQPTPMNQPQRHSSSGQTRPSTSSSQPAQFSNSQQAQVQMKERSYFSKISNSHEQTQLFFFLNITSHNSGSHRTGTRIAHPGHPNQQRLPRVTSAGSVLLQQQKGKLQHIRSIQTTQEVSIKKQGQLPSSSAPGFSTIPASVAKAGVKRSQVTTAAIAVFQGSSVT